MASLAAELGISRTTVSNAYNRPEQLSAQLRTRILDAARTLGYPGPDPVARSLRTKRAGAIGLVLADKVSYAVRDPVAIAFLEGLTEECDRARVGLLLVPADPDAEDVAAVSAAASIDGFVAFAMADEDPHLEAVLDRGVPTVICDQPVVPGVDSVGIDDKRRWSRSPSTSSRSGTAASGWPACGWAGPTWTVRWIWNGSSGRTTTPSGTGWPGCRPRSPQRASPGTGSRWSSGSTTRIAAGASAAAELLTLDPGLTAIIATSDVLALGVLQELARRHQRVPQDVAVTGFDGIKDALSVG